MPGVTPTCFEKLPDFYKKPYNAMVRRARNANSTPPSEDWYFKQLCAQDWRCELTGIEFNDKVANWDDANQSQARYWVPSIDRIDNRKGYEQHNLRIVCNIYNWCRGTAQDNAFDQMCVARARKLAQLGPTR